MSNKSFLYINHEEEEATGKLPFIENESTAAIVQRSIALGEIHPFLPFAYKASVSIDGGKTFFNDVKTKLTERPKNGDVTLRIQKKPAKLYVHFFDSGVDLHKKFDEPKDTVAVKVSEEQVSKCAPISRQMIVDLVPNASKHALFARSSADGEFVQLKETGTTTAFPFFPFNGDIFAVAASAADVVTQETVQAAMKQAEALLKQQRFSAAADLFQGLLDMLGSKDQQLNPAALPLWHQIGVIYSEKGARIPTKSIDALRNCLKIARKMPGTEAGKQAVTYATNLAKELFNAKQYREAANMFQEAFDLVRGDVTLSQDVLREMRIRMGAALYMGGAKPQGMQMVQEAVSGDTTNTLGVYWMSKFYAEMDHDDDALQWAATLVLNRSEDRQYRQNFAEIVSGIPDAIDILKKKIINGNSPKHAQVWCFLGLILNDAGFLMLSKQFYEIGLELDPDNASYVLNYVHVLEHLNKLPQAINYLVKFLEKKGDVKLGMNKIFSPTPVAVARAIRGLSPLPNVEKDKNDEDTTEAELEEAKKKRKELVDEQLATAGKDSSSSLTVNTTPCFLTSSAIRFKSHEAGKEELGDFHHMQFFDKIEDAFQVPAIAIEARDDAATKRDSRPSKNALFGENDLNIAGLYFTAVKFLFALGVLDRLPYLISLINPLRLHQQFHETKMKNEHSYFSTIAAAVQFLTVPKNVLSSSPIDYITNASGAPEEDKMTLSTWMAAPSRCLFYVGDSHSVTPGWHFVHNKKIDKNVLLVNRLVTGLKIWHMRPETNFYPKKQFEAVTAMLPQNSTAIFNFGEIDCREAVLSVVQRGLYATNEECFEHLARIYIQALLDIKRLRRLSKIVVIGPLPTLDPTRHLVVSCNKVFARMFANSSDIKSGAHQIIFIDVCDRVLATKEEDPLGTRLEFVAKAGEPRVLRSDFHFDRTHIHPCFVSKVLEPVLNEVVF